jgi:hypothetical protein
MFLSARRLSGRQPAPQPAQASAADDSARLLELANQLKAEMGKATKDELSVSVVRKAEAIERLAHQMRGR